MSLENLNKFMQFVDKDKEAAKKVKDMGNNVDAIISYGRELGYEFDRGDLERLGNETAKLVKAGLQKKLERIKDAAPEQEPAGMLNLKKFVQLIDADASVAGKVQEIGLTDPSAIIAYAEELGFDFDQQDMEEFGNILLEQTDELSDEELDLVAGGVIPDVLGVVGSVAGAGAAVAVLAVVGAGVLAEVLAEVAVAAVR